MTGPHGGTWVLASLQSWVSPNGMIKVTENWINPLGNAKKKSMTSYNKTWLGKNMTPNGNTWLMTSIHTSEAKAGLIRVQEEWVKID